MVFDLLELFFGTALIAGKALSDRGKEREFDKKMSEIYNERQMFMNSVRNDRLERELRKNPFTEDNIKTTIKFLNRLPYYKDMTNLPRSSKEAIEYNRHIVLVSVMVTKGFLPCFISGGGNYSLRFWPIISSYSPRIIDEDVIVTSGRLVQDELRSHDVKCQLIYNKDDMTAPLVWEPWANNIINGYKI